MPLEADRMRVETEAPTFGRRYVPIPRKMESSCLLVETKSSASCEPVVLPLLLGKDSIDELSDELADLRSLSKSGLCKAPTHEKIKGISSSRVAGFSVIQVVV